MQSILSISLIISIVSILSLSISACCNWQIMQMTQQTLGWPFGVKKSNFLRLLAFTGICKGFTRYLQEINQIPLGVMTSNSHWGKIYTLRNCRGGNISPVKKWITIVIWHLGSYNTNILDFDIPALWIKNSLLPAILVLYIVLWVRFCYCFCWYYHNTTQWSSSFWFCVIAADRG